MDNLKSMLKKGSSSEMIRKVIRASMVMPANTSQLFISKLTAPTKTQSTWIKYVEKKEWKGAIIAQDIYTSNESQALWRLCQADLVIFNIHGGGFRVGHCAMYMDAFIQWLTNLKIHHKINAVILSVEYAPLHKYPTPILECANAYKFLIHSLGIPGRKIVLTGDSAGGAICLEMLVRACAPSILTGSSPTSEKECIERPAGMVLVSPLITAESTSESWKKFNKTDIVGIALKKLILKEFLGHPEVDVDQLPIMKLSAHARFYVDLFMPKNVLIFVGDREVMRDDIVQFAADIAAQDDLNIKVIKEDFPHNWYLVRELVKQKQKPMLAKYDRLFADFAANATDHQPKGSLLSISSQSTVKRVFIDSEKNGRIDNSCAIVRP